MEIEDTPATAGMLEKELPAFRKILIEVNCNVDAACTNGSQHAEQNIQCHRKIKILGKNYIGCMVYGKTKIPDPGTGKEVPVPRSEWKVLENHHEPIVSKETFEKAQSLQIRHIRKSEFNKETTLLSRYVKCGNCRRSLTGSSRVHGHILYSCAYGQGKEDTGCFAGKADDKMLEHMVLAEIKAYLRQNISQEQMQQFMRK